MNVGIGGDGELGEVLYVGPEQRVLPHAQVTRVLRVEQVPHALAVNLHVAHLDGILRAGKVILAALSNHFGGAGNICEAT